MTGKKRQPSPIKDDSLEQLQKQRISVLSNINRIKKSLLERTISHNPFELEGRLEILTSYADQVMTIQSRIEYLDNSDEQREEIENACVSAKSIILSILGKHRKPSLPENSFSFPTHHSRLPNMKLPKFGGKYSEYKNFISLFENLVDNDTSLTNIEKFNHLISCLVDEALGTVKAFQISDENYPKALASLKRVYDNKCLIFFDCISKLFDLPSISKPSASSLRSMIDTVSALYDSLLSLGDDKKITNAILIYLVMSKVDIATKTKWEESLDYVDLPSWSDCELALNKRYQHIAADENSISRGKTNDVKKDFNTRKGSKTSLACLNSNGKEQKCFCCKSKEHIISSCPSFTALSVSQRFDFAKSVPICINCLRKGHTVTKCNASRCRVCQRPHNTLLHQYSVAETNQQQSLNLISSQSSTSKAAVNHTLSSEDGILLATAIVNVENNCGQYNVARMLLDSGSMINLMTESLAQRLKVRKVATELDIVGIGGHKTIVKYKASLLIKSRVNSYDFTSDFYIVKNISKYQPETSIPTENWSIPKNIVLADPSFSTSQKVDMLIGSEIFFDLLSIGQIKTGHNLPIIQKTLLGWVVAGKYKKPIKTKLAACNVSTTETDLSTIDYTMKKFWELETIISDNSRIKYTPEHNRCEKSFSENIKRLESGRFSVVLPFKSNPDCLGQSYQVAKRRFLSLEHRLCKNSEFYSMYLEFMREYINLGHMSLVENKIPLLPHYFIPHQCVLRPQSSTTKLRVVFDASCRSSTNISLNDILMVGPTIQEDLYSILLRFRVRKYAITADITKMYRQIQVDEADRSFQMILWRENPSQPIQIYQLNTVTYGTSPAPYLAIRCINHISDIMSKKYPFGSEIIKREFYVDDLLSGADTFEKLEKIRIEVTSILESAGFVLAKWYSNHPNYHSNDQVEKDLKFNNNDSTTTLGIQWIPSKDIFRFEFDELKEERVTKRNILSISSRLFDPLGLLSPIITRAKMLLQEIWLKKLDWDESVPLNIETSWSTFRENLNQIHKIEIPRFVGSEVSGPIQIHGFADASERAYGCCLYIRSYNVNRFKVLLLTAKSKVAPLKKKSLPKLELCAAHLLAKLWTKVEPLLNGKYEKVVFWSDSEICLHWVKTHPSSLQTFVANRVAEIQEWTPSVCWNHVPTKQNPADIVSRGCGVDDLIESMWFHGPDFLNLPESCWPINHHLNLSENQLSLEKKKHREIFLAVEESTNNFMTLIEKYSNYSRLLRVMAYIHRFIIRCRNKKVQYRSLIPTAQELNLSFLRIVQMIQLNDFHDEIINLKKANTLKPVLQKLNPFLNEEMEGDFRFTLIRVGGRLANAPIAFDAKFPLLMSKNSHFIKTYLLHLHNKNSHAGPKALLAFLRQRIWVLGARELCTKTVRKCIRCFRYKPKLITQIMGNLPIDRLRAMRPFMICGVDYCGPVYVTLKIRGRAPIKMYIAIFVCFTSKAVHIELVGELTTDCFISSLRRFTGRRGVPKRIYCDNATNFVGAERKLDELREAFQRQQGDLELYTSEKGIEFCFIPPRAPHFGGLWEAAVKSAKHHLVRTLGSILPTTEELQTALVEVEALLNSRPIAPMSNDPNDGEALTPSHLILGEQLGSLPPELEHDVPENKIPSLKRWQQLCAVKQAFWRKWAKDYILELQQRGKWIRDQPNLAVGKLVVIQEDNMPPQQWALGRVINVIEGSDNKVRVADVKTAKGVFRRTIHRLAPLPDV